MKVVTNDDGVFVRCFSCGELVEPTPSFLDNWDCPECQQIFLKSDLKAYFKAIRDQSGDEISADDDSDEISDEYESEGDFA